MSLSQVRSTSNAELIDGLTQIIDKQNAIIKRQALLLEELCAAANYELGEEKIQWTGAE